MILIDKNAMISKMQKSYKDTEEGTDRASVYINVGISIGISNLQDSIAVDAIPVEWLKEKLTGHPELSYSITDGIQNVLDLWEARNGNS